jgi:hypothetical protein
MFNKTAERQKKDPLKQNPLPQAGDSTYQALVDLVDDKLLFWCFAVLIAVAMALGGWLTWRYRDVSVPVVMTLVAAVVGIVGTIRGCSAWKQAKNLRLGMRGEMSVGQRLEELRALGYRVFHDIPQKGFNIDHVLIGPGGVFVIETKTISKPAARDARVTYDGERILIDGHERDRDPIAQVQACADRIGEILLRATNRQPPIRQVVLFPDWFVAKQPRGVEVWVLNPDAFSKFLEHESKKLTPQDVALFASALETHVRASR